MITIYMVLDRPIGSIYPLTLTSLEATIRNMIVVGGVDASQTQRLRYQLNGKPLEVTFSSEIAKLSQGNPIFTITV